jgi:hypothetical protein
LQRGFGGGLFGDVHGDDGLPHATFAGGSVEYTFSRFKYTHLYGGLTGDITDNLAKWSTNPPQPGPLSLETISTIDNGLTDTVTQRSSTPLTNWPNQFLRLQFKMGGRPAPSFFVGLFD